MANDPGEWYEERRLEAERLGHELAGARTVLEAVHEAAKRSHRVSVVLEAAHTSVRRLERALEQARYVGD